MLSLLMIGRCIAFAQPGSYYPPPSSVIYQADTLNIYPPDSLPGPPVELVSYNIYIDGNFYDNILVADPEEYVKFYMDDEGLIPGNRIFCVSAVYNEWISENTCDTAMIIYGYEIPVYEDWSSGSFETLNWITTSDHWVIETNSGNPAPDAAFLGEPGLTDYAASLESYYINAVGMHEGKIWLDFDLKLESINSTNHEILQIQVWNQSSQGWTTVTEFYNDQGSFDWDSEYINIKSTAMNKVFKIRFVASGLNSGDIIGWYIDNLHVYRNCEKPTDLVVEETYQYNELDWIGNDWYNPYEWIHWDSGANAGNSVGTGSAVEFDVAARWTPEQISYSIGYPLDKIAFFPAESQATYNIRVWTGSGPDTLIVDQLVENPAIAAWNYISLDNPVVLDSNKELWVGYHISAETGYPAGVDSGPAHDGYGNMMYFDSTWSTLKEINPDLDFNWNIAAHFNVDFGQPEDIYYIYRQTNEQAFEFFDIANQSEYIDTNIILSNYYCYRVTEIWVKDGDTCESDPTNTACEELMLGTDQPEDELNISIYPNPASSYLYIESSHPIKEVRMYNMLGEGVLKLEIGNLQGRVDVRGMKNGIYFLEVVAGENTWKNKVLIIR
jgi:hypothetical protein